MYRAILYQKEKDDKVQCNLCAHRCHIAQGNSGFCCVRKNVEGVLYSLNYGKAVSACIDPIGKKPLSHFNPGARVLSIAAAGCNFRCQFCDNWMISQETKVPGKDFAPDEVVQAAKDRKCQGISYTYTEPTVYMEYALDIAKLAQKEGLFNNFVTNGYMTPEAVKVASPFVDAVTVDFKAGGDPSFYKRVSGASNVQAIYDALDEFKRQGVHVEITNLVIPRVGDDMHRIEKMATWIHEHLGEDTPFHLLKFHPDYKMTNTPATPLETLEQAYVTSKNAGLNYVYIGNFPSHPAENTYCPVCDEAVIKRYSFDVTQWNLTENMECPVCGQKIPIKGKYYPSKSSFPYALF
ncbi:MAG: AmmeMemoRadiSam system radical SAM enzyme [Candidatus Bathyarchaeota archaeon]|nr:AmmeMemoRadiSam system radical SAM enzyme [Candidatus Bathyarchaeota archaeon]